MGKGISSIIVTAMVMASLTSSCGHRTDLTPERNMTLVTVGDSTLTLADVKARIPAGLSAEDSLSLLSSIVESWLQDALLREMAAENMVDMERIDRMTADYRNRLIVNEYMRQRERTDSKNIAEGEVKAVFESEGAEMKLESPLIKGLYIKIPNDGARLEDVRRWMRSGSKSSVENLERTGVKGAVEYDRFTDRWVDWQEVSGQIPYDFGDADSFLSEGKYFETSDRASTYILHVTAVLHSGSDMPYDFAAPRIRESLNQRRRATYGRDLVNHLAEKARSEGRLTTPGYDLKSHQVLTKINNTKI